eukprot:scaffold56491_cov75-Phaeocystis_antarctica.AAC.4
MSPRPPPRSGARETVPCAHTVRCVRAAGPCLRSGFCVSKQNGECGAHTDLSSLSTEDRLQRTDATRHTPHTTTKSLLSS